MLIKNVQKLKSNRENANQTKSKWTTNFPIVILCTKRFYRNCCLSKKMNERKKKSIYKWNCDWIKGRHSVRKTMLQSLNWKFPCNCISRSAIKFIHLKMLQWIWECWSSAFRMCDTHTHKHTNTHIHIGNIWFVCSWLFEMICQYFQ